MKTKVMAILLWCGLIGMLVPSICAQSGSGGISTPGITPKFTSKSFKVTGSGSAVNLINQGIYNHTLIWSGAGTRTTCSIKLEQSVDASTWTDLIAAQNCVTNGTAAATGYVNYVRVTVTALTGSGNVAYGAYSGTGSGASIGAVTVTGSVLPTGAATETTLAAVNAKLPALGQALAAASVPVILPAATITTLTPPAAITGFATETTLASIDGKITAVNTGAVTVAASALPNGAATAAKQPAFSTAGTASTDVSTFQGIAGMVPILTAPGTADGADGAAPTNPPVPVTGRARATEVAVVDAGDSLTTTESLVGGILVHIESLPQDQWEVNSNGTPATNAALTKVIDHVDDYFYDVTYFSATNAHATAGSNVQLVQGTGTLCATNPVVIFELGAGAAYGGFVAGNGTGVIASTRTVSTDICIKIMSADASVSYTVKGFKSKLDRVSN